MPSYRATPEFNHGQPERCGVVLVNLGTPEAPTAGAVRRFLKQFLSDPRVIEYPRLAWWLILNLVILVIRPPKSAAAYRKIWTSEGSPLMVHSIAIGRKLRAHLKDGRRNSMPVELAMTYGEPSIAKAIEKLVAAGARRIVVLPLYPQYSGTTTAAVFDQVADAIRQFRWLPELRFINNYHDDPEYIAALATTVRQSWAQNGRGGRLLMSFHGVPKRTLLNGDPYHCQCQKTARLLAEDLGLSDKEWALSFQSRVGREEWLTPYTDTTVTTLGAEGLSQLDVICPGFSTDCLETLEEIELQNAEFFRAAGGGTLRYIPALNAIDSHVALLKKLVHRANADWQPVTDSPSADETKQRAEAMGAVA